MTVRTSRLDMRVDGARLVLTGRIDDSAQLESLGAKLPAGAVTIDTSAVTFINSVGMREWLRLIRVLRERGTVTLERVSDVLITQMNLIPEFGSSVTISSFHAQYLCPSCGHESAPLVDVATHAPLLQIMNAPKLPCPECGAQMDLGDFPERYLSIFRNR